MGEKAPNGLFDIGIRGPRCVVCGADADNEYKSNDYCDQHFQERMARETGAGY